MDAQHLPAGEYCIYLRKSRKDIELEAAGGADTLSRHRDTLLSLAHRLGLNITHIYEEVVSGDTISERPEMQNLLDAVELGAWKGVLVMEIPRLARGDTIDQGVVAQAFRYSHTLIITPEKTYYPDNEFDEEYMEFGLFMSRREYKAINRRIQRGRLFSVQEGKWVANKPPYGWQRVKLQGEKGYTLEPDPTTSETVKLMYDLAHDQRLKPPTIATQLNALGVPSPVGGIWDSHAVRYILRNPVNAGWVRWGARPQKKTVINGEVRHSRPRVSPDATRLYPGRHEALVSQDVFDDVVAFISGPSRPGPKQVETKNPLSGLIICGSCGHAMVRRPYQSGRKETLLCPHNYCSTVASDLDAVEASLLDALSSWLHTLELEAEHNAPSSQNSDPTSPLRAQLAALDKEHTKLAAQEQRAYELVEQGVYSTDTFLSRSKAISDKQAANRALSAHLSDELARLERQQAAHSQLIPSIRQVLGSYSKASSPKEKNDLLKSVLQKVVYTKSKRNNRYNTGGDMRLQLFPKLPH